MGKAVNQSNKVSHNILIYLKKNGRKTTTEIAQHFSLTSMAVRQHLHLHKMNDLVCYAEQHASRGRPKRVWFLTEKAEKTFPNDADKLLNFLVLACQNQSQKPLSDMLDSYLNALCQNVAQLTGDAKTKLKSLSKALNDWGYLNETIFAEDGLFRLSIYHCPHYLLVRHLDELYDFEKNILPAIAGHDFKIESVNFRVADYYYSEYALRAIGD